MLCRKRRWKKSFLFSDKNFFSFFYPIRSFNKTKNIKLFSTTFTIFFQRVNLVILSKVIIIEVRETFFLKKFLIPHHLTQFLFVSCFECIKIFLKNDLLGWTWRSWSSSISKHWFLRWTIVSYTQLCGKIYCIYWTCFLYICLYSNEKLFKW